MRTKQWILILLIATTTAIFIRMFVFETVRVGSPSMAETFQTGDRLMIEKWSVGPRLPMSLGIPLIPDSLPFGKTFIALTNNAKRISGFGSIGRNDFIAFNQPTPYSTYSRNPILLSRCVALPGELLELSDGQVKVNNQKVNRPVDAVNCYSLPKSSFSSMTRLLYKFDIRSEIFKRQDTGYVYLTKREWLSIFKEKLVASLSLKQESSVFDKLMVKIPSRGMQIELNDSTLLLYGTIILRYEQVSIKRDSSGIYFKNGQKSNRFVFKNNYYYLLNDHQGFLNDSRNFGMIPEQLIIGKACLVVFSSKGKRFMQGL